MVLYPDETEASSIVFERGYKDNGNTVCIGLMVNFNLGLRVGGPCALKRIDVDWKNETIFVHCMEDSSGDVVDCIKSDSEVRYRELVLPDSVIKLSRRVREDSIILSEYIFCNEVGTRKTKLQLLNKLRRV